MYPLVIKDGNGKLTINGGFNWTIIYRHTDNYTCIIIVDFSLPYLIIKYYIYIHNALKCKPSDIKNDFVSGVIKHGLLEPPTLSSRISLPAILYNRRSEGQSIRSWISLKIAEIQGGSWHRHGKNIHQWMSSWLQLLYVFCHVGATGSVRLPEVTNLWGDGDIPIKDMILKAWRARSCVIFTPCSSLLQRWRHLGWVWMVT